MAHYGHIIVFSLLGGIFSLVGGALLISRRRTAELLASYATPFAAGSLLAAVFLDLLNEAVEQDSAKVVFAACLTGICSFFLAERFLHWFHHHHEHHGVETKTDATASLVVVGDMLHNALDGVAIAVSFLVSVPTGIVTTLAVAAHEIPQEIGDFGLLLNKGFSRRKVLLVNFISALATTGMALLTFWLGSTESLPLGALLGGSAGFLLYIAMSDIIPTIHQEVKNRRLVDIRPWLLIFGALFVGLSITLAHKYIDPAHQDHHGGQKSHHSHHPAD